MRLGKGLRSPCQQAGDTFEEHTLVLFDEQTAEPATAQTDTVRVCEASLTVTAAGFGVEDVPVTTVC